MRRISRQMCYQRQGCGGGTGRAIVRRTVTVTRAHSDSPTCYSRVCKISPPVDARTRPGHNERSKPPIQLVTPTETHAQNLITTHHYSPCRGAAVACRRRRGGKCRLWGHRRSYCKKWHCSRKSFLRRCGVCFFRFVRGWSCLWKTSSWWCTQHRLQWK